MICCLNPDCHNPPNSDRTMFCSNCGTGLVVLRNRYRPIKTLGGGGFGKTYLTEDIDKLNEYCVIKQFAPQVQGTAALNKATELFQQEAKQLQQLGEHPQIPTLLAYFEQDNRLYLVQQFINGQNLLDELKQQGIFNEQKIRELLLDLLEIIKTVHQEKVIHRDIKPENIIRRGDGKLVLIDFGASKQLTATVMTQIGTTIGSFGYASLEQMQGGKAYPASDLYSLGVTCFHLLSGIHPWELWQRQGYGWVTNWRQHLQKPVSQELGRILDKLLQEEHQQRYQSAAEVLQAFNSESIPVTQPIIPPVTPPPRQKNSIPIYLAVIPLIVLMGAGTVYLLGLTNPVKIERKSAETYYQEGLAKYNNKDFRGAIEDYTQAIQINPNYTDAYINRGIARYDLEDKQTAIQDYNQAIIINPNYALAYYNRGIARYDLGDKQTAIEDYNQAIKLNPNYTDAYISRGLTRYDLRDNQAAIQDYNQAIIINPNYALAYYNRGLAHYNLRDNQAAIEDYNQAIKLNPNYANAYIGLGLVRSALGDKQAAIENYNQAITIDSKNAIAYYNRGNARSALGDNRTAIEDYNQAIENNPNYADAYYNRGNYRSALGDNQTALEDFRKSADLYKQQGRESDYQNALQRIRQLRQ